MITRYALAAPVAALLMLGACAKPAAEEAAGEDTAAAAEAPAEKPALAPDDPLTKVTCADFLATAEVATAQPANDAALAAQDELANGLTWLHGYLYAKADGGIEPLSQSWMQATAKRVFEACSSAEKPAGTSLFEVATS